METSKEYRNITKETDAELPANEAECTLSVLTGNMDNVEKYSIKSEIGEKLPKTKDESESEINGHIKIVADLEQITVVKNDYESDNVTSGDSDSGQILRIKTEYETQQVASQTYANHGVYPQKLSIKNEHKQNEYPETGNCNASSEIPTKCQKCECCFTEYLQYLDHLSVCVARKDNGDAFEVKIETDEIPELYSDNMLQSGEHLKGHATLPELKQEVNETSNENGKTTMTTDQDDTINYPNIPTQPIPQLLIQNTASCTDTLPTEKQSQEIPITCFYCNETFLHMDRLSCIQYKDILSDIKHMDRSSYIQHVQKHLDKMNKVNKYARFYAMHEAKALNDHVRNLFTVEITATLCKNRSCNYIFVDSSVCLKHELMAHSGYQFVCSNVDCHRVFPDKSSLRSHECANPTRTVHTRIVHVYPSKTADSVKRKRYSYTKSEFFDTIRSTKAKPIKCMIKKDAKYACGACGNFFSTSAELTSHIICGHPVTAKPFENLHPRGTVREVTKGEKEEIRTKIKKSKTCSQTERNCTACDNVKCNCLTGISQKQESCETSFIDSSTFRDRDHSKRSQNSTNSVQEILKFSKTIEKNTKTAGELCRDGKHIKAKNEQTFESMNKDSSINFNEDINVTVINKQGSKVYRCMAKGCRMVFDTSDERRKHVQEQHISISYKATYKNEKLLKHMSNYSIEGIKKSKSTPSDSSKSVTGKPCQKIETESKESNTALEHTCGVTDDGIKPISKCDEHIKGKFSNYNSCQRLKLKQHSAISSNEKKRKSGVLVYEFEDINDSNKKVKQLETLMRDEQRDDQKVEDDGKNEEISAGKYCVTHKFPCNFIGCHLLFNTNKEKMKHVTEQHRNPSSEIPEFPCMHDGCKMGFDTLEERRKHVHKQHILLTSYISPVRFDCTTPGCFKVFDRILDLKEHSRNCSNILLIKSKSHVSK